jgi:transcriptional regulator with XRE-family HTH domain
MNLGNNLFNARKKAGFSQEEVAEKLGISRQIISKWETNETIPNIYESKQLAQLYNLSLDELLDFDVYLKEIEEAIKNSNPAKEEKINWTNAWGKKYPILIEYHNKVDIKKYSYQIRELLNSLQKEYDYNNLDSMLVLKDILYHEWKDSK